MSSLTKDKNSTSLRGHALKSSDSMPSQSSANWPESRRELSQTKVPLDESSIV